MRYPLIVKGIYMKLVNRVNAKIVGIFLTHQLLVFGTGFIAKTINVVPTIKNDFWTIILNNLNNWDGRWYLRIASEGYNIKSAAFFPLYPLSIKLLSSGGIPPEWAGILISNGAFLLVCFLFYYLVRLDFDENTAVRSLLYMALFPTAYYFNAIYTESLFLAWVLAAFFLARKQCWPAAALARLLASATRNTGILLVVTHNYYFTRNLIDLGLTLLIIVACVIGRTKLRPEYTSYLILGFLIPLMSKSMEAGLFSMPRFLLVLFPIFIILGNLFNKSFYHNLLFNLCSGFLICFNLMFAFSRFVA